MHGLVYETISTDGDSSVGSTLRISNPYAEQGIVVKRIFCTNHLYRNVNNKVKKVMKVGELSQPRNSTKIADFVKLRAMVTNSGVKIRKCLKEAVANTVVLSISWDEKEQTPEHDIRNPPYHVFDEHKGCAQFVSRLYEQKNK